MEKKQTPVKNLGSYLNQLITEKQNQLQAGVRMITINRVKISKTENWKKKSNRSKSRFLERFNKIGVPSKTNKKESRNRYFLFRMKKRLSQLKVYA